MGRRKKLGKLWEKLGDDPEVIMRGDGADVFIVVDGVKIARRGYPNTPQAQTWVSLEPGWEVCGLETIEIRRRGVLVH
jgi:hypothetical protein